MRRELACPKRVTVRFRKLRVCPDRRFEFVLTSSELFPTDVVRSVCASAFRHGRRIACLQFEFHAEQQWFEFENENLHLLLPGRVQQHSVGEQRGFILNSNFCFTSQPASEFVVQPFNTYHTISSCASRPVCQTISDQFTSSTATTAFELQLCVNLQGQSNLNW